MNVTKQQMRPSGNMTDGLQTLVNLLPNRCVIIEIGSYRGESSAIFVAKAKRLICIDPWIDYEERQNGRTITMREYGQIEADFDVFAALHPGVVEKWKMTSREAAPLVPDGAADCVYIDGLHEEAAVREDILMWRPKVKDGGILAGHDYGYVYTPCVPSVVQELLGGPDQRFLDSSWMKRIASRGT